VALDLVADGHRDLPARSVTGAPRTRPSVGCIEMARTRLSPMCCAISSTSEPCFYTDLDVAGRRRAARLMMSAIDNTARLILVLFRAVSAVDREHAAS
jgi:hypothetical protein